MAKQLSVNEWKYLFEKYEKWLDLGNSLKKCFLNEMMKIKNVRTHFWRSMKEIQWISIKDINLGIEHRINEWKIA